MTVPQLDVEHLLQELTLNEKISLLAGMNNWSTVPIERLAIPSVTVSDGPNGIRGTRFFDAVPSNCFPCGTGMAATFNKDLLVQAGELMAAEAKMKNCACILGPTCNIARGPLGGRAFESYSEDPYLSGHVASAVVNGIQKHDVVACLKHFVCNDQEHERKGVDSILTERALREVYLKPFQLAVRDSNPKSMMTAYNRVNGVHVSQSKKLLQEVLRQDWKWDGMVMSDWYGVYSMKESLDAGLNLEMPGPTRFRELVQTSHAVVCNEIHRDTIDDNVRHVLHFVNDCLKAEIPEGQVESENTDPAAGELLRKIGGESIVLLKNEDSILPLSAEKAKGNEVIALIGPNVKAERNSGGGSASLRARYTVTPWQGIASKVQEKAGPNAVVLDYALGAFLEKTLPDIGSVMQTADGHKGMTARFYADAPGAQDRGLIEERTVDTTKIFLSDYHTDKLPAGQQLFYVDFEGYYVPEETSEYWFGCSCLGTAQMFLDGELIVDNKTTQVKGDAFFLAMGTREERTAVKLEKGRKYKLNVEFGTSPTCKLVTEYQEVGGVFFGIEAKSTGQAALDKAVEIARKADKVVMVTGLSKEHESEGFDRPDMDIPGWTDKLIAEVARVNPNVVVVNQSGSPVTMPWVDLVKGVVQAWYGGNELGNSLADVLFGDVNPSGKLSMTFPKRLQDNPSYLNFGSTHGHVLYGEDVFVGYRYYEKIGTQPLYAFGHGLSYTSFDLGAPEISLNDDEVSVSVKVTNSGKVAGDEVVQFYVEPTAPKIIRPKKELKDFAKVKLAPGETKTVSVKLPTLDVTSYWDSYKNKWLSEKGTYKVMVGTSSDKIAGSAEFQTSADKWWTGV
ncbi:hypothetical protein METBIDRAFT_33396 [Metschnikowia bicuspidata var. bicuspidata NRRL YB-4993]|uniref:beta-glucosidase n=1 Tax=Metschnikowia bicuspidata var. bicuspidata NRRL YB-4993 TaxID=869754 RepID=A0A1A0H5G4_9ASCO|nr:hypothetical protein METBIDRAFT_33396 [Metschnikowia bicuspidata var. bicuspidata NRRL YB-4993]OBA19185.1 hypothetical protein METBIDRAFT_33396 [Metschnikowia bicuspidata var. bicuspidata NRRL YB-4993]